MHASMIYIIPFIQVSFLDDKKKFFLFWNRPGLKEKIERQKGVVNIPSCDELCETQHNLGINKIEKHLRFEFLH